MNRQMQQQKQPVHPLQRSRRSSTGFKVTLGVIFIAVLVVGFLGYLTPAMRVSWEAVASMCGF